MSDITPKPIGLLYTKKDPITHLSRRDLDQMNRLAQTDLGMRDLLLKCHMYYILKTDAKEI
jgi:hypothetical protein